MPRPLSPRVKSLQECCTENIVNNIDKWCYQYVEKYGPNKLDHLDVDGPFDSLPSTFLEQIIETLGEKKLLKREHIEFLVTPKLKTLDIIHGSLDRKDILGFSGFLLLTSIRCPNLKVLRWRANFKKPITLLLVFLPMFEKLQELYISNCKTGDSCLQVLGAYCKELRILNADDCSDVTDVGIKGLCAAIFDETGRDIQTMGQCKSVHTLKVRKTKVTKKGIQLALENLPALRVFEFDFPVQILAELHEECNFPNYQLVSLLSADGYERSPRPPYKNGSLGLVASLMSSSLTKVHIATLPGWTDQELLGLLHLNSLCELAILGETKWNECSITFDGGIVPLLKAFGNSLTSLSIVEVYELRVNVRAIVEYCPKLEFLNLKDTGDYIAAPLDEKRNSTSKRMKKDLILENLKVLELHCDPDEYEISPEGLEMLLSSPALVKLEISFCATVDDRILRKAFDLHQFRNLQSLEVRFCDNVTEEGIYLFMNENNSLANLGLHYCELLTLEFVYKLRDLAFQKKWNIDIGPLFI